MLLTTEDLERYGPPAFCFTSPYIKSARFEGRSLSRPPDDNTLAFLYGWHGDTLHQLGAAIYRDGNWKRYSKAKGPEPTHWVAMVDV